MHCYLSEFLTRFYKYRISSYSCRGNYSFLEVGVRQVFKGGNCSREETIGFFFIYEIHTYEKRSINIAYFLQFRSSKLIFVVKRQLKLENLAKKVPHVAFWLFCDNICSNCSSTSRRKTFQMRKLFRGGNYSREKTINN